jgi:hypothetical protein
MNILGIVGIAVGAAFAYLLVRAATGSDDGHGITHNTKEARIKIRNENGVFVSMTTPATLGVSEGDPLLWHVDEPPGGIGNGAVELRFRNEDSPVTKRRPKDQKEHGRRRIRDDVKPNAARKEPYHYEIWYVVSATEQYMMEDPEIQVESN